MWRAPTFVPQAWRGVAENATTQSRPDGRRGAYAPRVAASVVVVLAAVGYVVFVQSTHLDRKSLAALVIDQTGVTALKSKPVEAEFVSPQKSAFAAVKKAAAADPDETGGYGKGVGGLDGFGRCRHPARRDPPHVGTGATGARRGRSRVHGRQLVEGGTHHRDRPLHRADRGGRVRGEPRHGKVEHGQREEWFGHCVPAGSCCRGRRTSSRPPEGSAGPTPRRSPGPSTPCSSSVSRRSP